MWCNSTFSAPAPIQPQTQHAIINAGPVHFHPFSLPSRGRWQYRDLSSSHTLCEFCLTPLDTRSTYRHCVRRIFFICCMLTCLCEREKDTSSTMPGLWAVSKYGGHPSPIARFTFWGLREERDAIHPTQDLSPKGKSQTHSPMLRWRSLPSVGYRSREEEECGMTWG